MLLGILVGAGLAVCGVALQAMVRNVLADPYLLGINSGASSGAAAAILFGAGAGFGQYALSASAFLGALAASLLVFLVARSGGRIASMKTLRTATAVLLLAVAGCGTAEDGTTAASRTGFPLTIRNCGAEVTFAAQGARPADRRGARCRTPRPYAARPACRCSRSVPAARGR